MFMYVRVRVGNKFTIAMDMVRVYWCFPKFCAEFEETIKIGMSALDRPNWAKRRAIQTMLRIGGTVFLICINTTNTISKTAVSMFILFVKI